HRKDSPIVRASAHACCNYAALDRWRNRRGLESAMGGAEHAMEGRDACDGLRPRESSSDAAGKGSSRRHRGIGAGTAADRLDPLLAPRAGQVAAGGAETAA